MMNLIPLHTKDLDYLFELVSERTKWFIKLRYIAVAMLLGIYIILIFTGSESFYPGQKPGILILVLSILFYNIILTFISVKGFIKSEIDAFNPLKFAMLQIILDLTSLMTLVYITGLINSPFYLFFIFHAIIGSLILPGRVVYFLMVIVLITFSLLNLITHYALIPEFAVSNFNSLAALNIYYLILKLLAFWFMILLSVMFVNSLTSALYRREQQLMEAIQKIEMTEQEKQKYIMAVVHEVKSPLSVIVSYLNLLLSGTFTGLNDKVKDILVKMKRRSDEAIELTNDILEVSRIRQVKELRKEVINPVFLIDNIIEKLEDKLKNDKISIKLSPEIASSEKFSADKHYFELLMSNIISNSIKYNHPGGKIEVKVYSEDNKVCIKISDTGIGIPADELHKISDEFYRAQNAKAGRFEGTGLGMYVVKQILERHGGEMKIISPSGIGDEKYPGTTVLISFPM